MSAQNGFTLVELTVVVGVVGTLAAVAIPSYGEHLARGQVAEAVERIDAARVQATEHFVSTGVWPSMFEAAQTGTVGVTITAGGGTTGPAFTLTATLSSTGVNYAIASKSVELATRDGGVTWVCRGGSLEPQYLPPACKS